MVGGSDDQGLAEAGEVDDEGRDVIAVVPLGHAPGHGRPGDDVGAREVLEVLPHSVGGEDHEELLAARVGAQLVVAHRGRTYDTRVLVEEIAKTARHREAGAEAQLVLVAVEPRRFEGVRLARRHVRAARLYPLHLRGVVGLVVHRET
eukprot:scaffold42858_cov55-Phaeocystis_antarctica.AAC.2